MNCEERIVELEKRIEVLEESEQKRVNKRKMKIAFEIGKFVIIILLIFVGYIYIYSNFIKPYKEKIDQFEEKVDKVENFIGDQLDVLNKYNPFS